MDNLKLNENKVVKLKKKKKHIINHTFYVLVGGEVYIFFICIQVEIFH